MISGNPDAADITGNTALHLASLKGQRDCVSFLVNFGVNLWALNNDHQTAKEVVAISTAGVNSAKMNEILQMLDEAMAKEFALNPKTVKKLKERALLDAEKRLRIFEKLQKKAIKKAEKEEKDMEKKRKKLLIEGSAHLHSHQASTNGSVCPTSYLVHPHTASSSCTSKSSGQRKDCSSLNSMKIHLFESKSCSKVIPQKYSEIVNSNGSHHQHHLMSKSSAPPKAHSLGAVSKRILQKKLNISGSMLNLSTVPSDTTASSPHDTLDFKISQKLNPDSGYFSKSSVRSLSGLKRDNDVLYVKKRQDHSSSHYENMYHSMNQLSLKNQSWLEMFNHDHHAQHDLHPSNLHTNRNLPSRDNNNDHVEKHQEDEDDYNQAVDHLV